MRRDRVLLILAALLGLVAGAAQAQAQAPTPAEAPTPAPPPIQAQAPTPAPIASTDPAVAVVEGLYDGVRLATVAGAGTPVTRLAAISDTLARTFDFPEMTRLAVGGARWRNLPAPKQAALVTAVTRYFSITYANRLSAAVGGKFEVQPTSEARGDNKLVRSRVVDARGNTTDVDYVVRTASGRVSDVLLAGTVSEVGTLRSQFEPPLKSGGPDALEAFLRERGEAILTGSSSTPG